MNHANRRLYIVGAGSMARELASWIRFEEPDWAGYSFGGFLSDEPNVLADYPVYRPGIVSSIVEYQPESNDSLVMAIADPKTKLQIAQYLEARGANFVTFVHPSVLIADHVKIGRGVVLCPNVIVSCHAELGDFVAVNLSATVGHDVMIGRGCTLSAHVDITGFVELGEGVFLGSHASVLPRAKVGAYSRVGAGTVVLHCVKAGATVMGVPAKQVIP
jgi:sugar O-acyltransferase (sialic acid O-acetyltransferase NeuD family)